MTGFEFVDDTAPATPQMKEFALRTHQDGVPDLAKDYLPAEVDTTAVPVRVENIERPAETFSIVLSGFFGAGSNQPTS